MAPAPELTRESSGVFRLAVPVILIQIGSVAMGTVDTMMLGRFSAEALASGALGHSISFAMLSLPMGVLMALDPLVSQAYGAGDGKRIQESWRQGLLLAVVLTLPLVALMWDVRWLLRLTGQPEAIHDQTVLYVRGLIPGNLGFLLFIAVRQTLQALSFLRPLLIPIIGANLVNALVNYVLIFGHFGFPRLGVLGSAWATSTSRWVMFLGVLLAMPSVFRKLKLEASPSPGSWRKIWRPFKIGLPIGLHLSLEIWLFASASLMMGHLGALQLAGHQVAINMATLTFMVPYGIGAAAATRVGNAIGARSLERAKLSARVCLMFGAGLMSLSALAFWWIPEALARLYTSQPEVIRVTALLLPVAAIFQVFDAVQVVSSGILRGTGDTRVPAIAALLGYWGIGLPLGYFLTFSADFGPRGLWWGLTAGLGSVSILLLARVVRRFRAPIDDLLLKEE